MKAKATGVIISIDVEDEITRLIGNEGANLQRAIIYTVALVRSRDNHIVAVGTNPEKAYDVQFINVMEEDVELKEFIPESIHEVETIWDMAMSIMEDHPIRLSMMETLTVAEAFAFIKEHESELEEMLSEKKEALSDEDARNN